MRENLGIWLISVVGITFLGCFLRTITPDGKTGKAASFVLSLIIALSIINPLLSLANINYDKSEVSVSEAAVNERISEISVNFAKKYYFNEIKSELKKNKIIITKANIDCYEKDGSYYLEKIIIDKKDLEYSDDLANIDISSLIADIINKKYSIDRKDIVIYE